MEYMFWLCNNILILIAIYQYYQFKYSINLSICQAKNLIYFGRDFKWLIGALGEEKMIQVKSAWDD